ncbi:hypothetical protein BH11ARM2_BH11ARM2_03370 [soil metagenome]
MTYLALGDSISIDLYTKVEGGGAASQLARKLGADPFLDLTRDGMTSDQLLDDLRQDQTFGDIPKVDAVTLTIGGNDLLSGYFFREEGAHGAQIIGFETLRYNVNEIADLLAKLQCPVVMNTIYDPTDGDDSHAAELGLPPEARQGLIGANAMLREVAVAHGFLLCDLESLCQGHGFWSSDPWMVMHIEPSLKGATQIAEAWHRLLD